MCWNYSKLAPVRAVGLVGVAIMCIASVGDNDPAADAVIFSSVAAAGVGIASVPAVAM